MPINVKELTPTGKEFRKALRSGELDTLCWVGPIRSGKTVSIISSLVELALRNAQNDIGNHQYIIAAPTLGSIDRNITDPFEEVCNWYQVPCKIIGGKSASYEITYRKKSIKFLLFGGDNKRSYTKVRGSTVHSAWIDEATLCDEQFIQSVFERCSYDDSRVILSMNADSPYHPIKRTYIDELNDKGKLFTSSFYENQYYGKERAEAIANLNPGSHIYKRNVLNQWAPEDGLCIPIGPEQIWSAKDIDNVRVDLVSVDPGSGSVTAAVAGMYYGNKMLIVDEYYSERKHVGVKSEGEHLKELVSRWGTRAKYVFDPGGGGVVMLDAARRMGLHSIHAYDKDIEEGLLTVNSALYGDRLAISDKCTKLLGEAAAYAYNPNTGKPIDRDNHACDALRYAVMEKFRGRHFV